MPTDWTVRAISRAMLPVLLVLTLVEVGSGLVLGSFESSLLRFPTLLVLVPATIGTAGNLGSIMCSRLSTQLHLGTPELTLDNPDIRANVGAVLGLGLTVFVLVGIAAWAIAQPLGGVLGLAQVMTISLVSGGLLSVFVVVCSLAAVWTSYRLGYNPDDTTIPVVTNVCDITGVLILFGVVSIVL
jgi:mgtE-like transporter